MKSISTLLTLLLACMAIQSMAQVDVTKDDAGNKKVGINKINPEKDIHMRGSELLFEEQKGDGSLQIKMYIGPDGKVGIGTAVPDYAMDVRGAIATGGNGLSGYLKLRRGDGAAIGQLGYDANDGLLRLKAGGGGAAMAFFVDSGAASTERMRITADGKIGIGTTTPQDKFHIAGDTWIARFSHTDGRYTRMSGNQIAAYNANNTIGTLYLNNEGGIVTTQANIGIGTTTPEGKLSVIGDVGIGSTTFTNQSAHMLDIASTKGAASQSAIRALYPAGGGLLNTEFAALAHRSGQWNAIYAKQGASGAALYTEGEVNLMSGNVGIGTASPSATLEVAGKTKTTTLQVTTGAAAGKVLQSDANGNATWADPNTLAGANDNLGNHTASQNVKLNGKWLSGDGGNEGILVANSGSVGIGTASPLSILDIRSSNPAITVGTPTSTAGALYFGNSSHGVKRNYSNGNDVGLYTTAGNIYLSAANTSTSQFQLNSAGNVGIGISPTTKLDVNGKTKTTQLQVTTGAAAGKVLQSDAAGNATWADPNTLAGANDNLGNHTASQNINLNGKWISGNGSNQGIHINANKSTIGINATATDDADLTFSGASKAIGGNGINTYHNLATAYFPGASTGTAKITLPKSWSNTMMKITISGYNYSGIGAWELVVSGYNYSGQYWVNYSGELRGSAPFDQVRLGHDGTNCVLLLGNTTTRWSYGKINIEKFEATHTQIDNWGDLWRIDQITSETGITKLVNVTLPIYQAPNNNVGIGTTTPTQKLDVTGNIKASSNLYADGRYLYLGLNQLYGDNSSALYYSNNHSTVTQLIMRDKENLQYGRLYGDGDGANFGLMDGDGNWSYLAAKDNYTSFRINNSEKLRLESSGAIKFTGYTGTNHNGTPTSILGVDASGNVVKTAAAGINTPNIYSSDGSLSTSRTIQLDGSTLNFQNMLSGTGSVSFKGMGSSTGSLSITSPEGNPGIVLYSNDNKRANIGRRNDGLGIGVGSSSSSPGSSDLFIQNDGNVGIGTSTPKTKLDAQGPNNYWQATFGNSGIWKGDVNNWKRIVFGGRNDDASAAGYDVVLRTSNGSGILTLQDGTGNVGIGTNTPSHKLDLGSSLGRKLALYQSGNDFYGFGISPSTMEFHAGSQSNTAPKMTINALGVIKLNTYTGSNHSGTPTALLGVDATGNVVKTESAGALIQQKFAKTSAARQTIASATPQVITGLSIPFTPKRSNSIIVIEAVISTTAEYVSSYGVFKNGAPTASTSGFSNANEPNMQVTTYGSGNAGYLSNIKVLHFENAGTTATRTYDIRASSAWGGGVRTLYINNRSSNDMASISYMTVKEIVGEEVVSSIKIDPNEFQKSLPAPDMPMKEDVNQETTIIPTHLESKLAKQAQEIETLKILVEALLEEKVSGLERIEVALENAASMESAYISQNIPNPTANDAIIKYYVPEHAVSAQINFFSLSGQILKEVDINQMGQGELKVDLDRMMSGSYMYNLIVDGKLIDTKTMVIIK